MTNGPRRAPSWGRRLAYLVLVVTIVVAARVLFQRPVQATLAIDLGPDAAQVRAVDLVLTDAHDRVARDLHLAWPEGAPREVRHPVRLTPGDYHVGARVDLATGPPRQLTRALHVEQAGTYPLDLSK